MSSGGFRSSNHVSKPKKAVLHEKRKQSRLTSFFEKCQTKKRRVEEYDVKGGGSKLQCPYCPAVLFSQGFANHVRAHEAHGDSTRNPRPFGRAKNIGPRYSEPFVHSAKQDMTSTNKNDSADLHEMSTSTALGSTSGTSSSVVVSRKRNRKYMRNLTLTVSVHGVTRLLSGLYGMSVVLLCEVCV